MNYHLQVLNRKACQAKLLIMKNIPASMFSRHSTSVRGIEHQTCGFRAPKLYHLPLSHRDSMVIHFIIQRGTWFHQIL